MRAGLPGRGDLAGPPRGRRATSSSSRTTRRSSPRCSTVATSRSARPVAPARSASSAPTPSSSRAGADPRHAGRSPPRRRARARAGAGLAASRRGSTGRETSGPTASSRTSGTPTACPRPARLDELFEEQGVDHALLFCEYSPRVTGIQRFEDLLPIVEHNPARFRPVANVNPHLHFPIADEVRRQLDLGAAALKLHPVHGGFRCDDARALPGLPGARRAWRPADRALRHEHVPGLDERARRPGVPAARRARLPDRRRRAGARRPWLVVRRGRVHGAGEPERLDRALRAAAEAAARLLPPPRPRAAGAPLDLRDRLARRPRHRAERPRRRRARTVRRGGRRGARRQRRPRLPRADTSKEPS